MLKTKFLIFFLTIIIFAVATITMYVDKPDNNKSRLVAANVPQSIVGVREYGEMKVGNKIPLGPGDGTYAPYKKIPPSKFYINIAQKDFSCILDYCSSVGAYVQTMGGWLQAVGSSQAVSEIFNLDLEKNNIQSLVVVGDKDAKIVGLYPNRGMDDLLSILKLHPAVANFDLLKGVDAFGSLKVGELAPIKPGDPTGYKPGESTNFPYEYIPKGKKFYIYAIQKYLSEPAKKGYCAFYECLWYEEFDYIEEAGGWYSNNGRSEIIQRFGLNPNDVKSGRSSLVVVTDSEGKIVALHPGKTYRDFIAILKQLPELADVEKIYYKK